MPRWNNSLKDNCIDILNNTIKNVEPSTYNAVLDEVLFLNLKNNKKEIETFVRNKLGIVTSNSRRTKQYWILRGWSDGEAYVRSKENKQTGCRSVYSREFWLDKINPTTGELYTITEADFERNSRRPIRKEYWLAKGYNDKDAIRLAEETKLANNKKGAKKSADSNVRRVTSKRCSEYYTARGYSEDEAKLLVSEGQKYFSKKICIEKYGKDKGMQIWRDRQTRWQETLNSKPDEEKARINRLKTTKGITKSKAETEILNEMRRIKPELTLIHQHTLFRDNKKQYIYDISVGNKIIEYNGDFWHCNPQKYPANYINPRTKLSANETWIKDQAKIQFAQNQGYEVLVIWESEFKKNKEEVLQKCIQFLTQ
jgi:G:T-mismatch repair DNA endonuclease (very short patch repair protein)